MKIDFNFEVKSFNGISFLDEEKKPLMAFTIIANTLINHQFKEGDFFDKYLLAEKIYKEKAIELTDKEFTLITSSLRFIPPDGGIHPVVRGYILKQLNQLTIKK